MSSDSLDSGRIAIFRQALGLWYERCRRDLPWRRTGDPYAVWVSEVMLQQTQVATVIPYYERWMVRFPDLFRLAAADLQAVLKRWEGLGYYARARHFHRAARIVMERHGGKVPDDPAAFRGLPGVGEYIAAAVMSIAFGRPMAVVDGNVKRVLARLLASETPVNGAGAHKAFAPAARVLLDNHRPGRANQALMELGALVCTPRRPRCSACPLAFGCLARQKGSQGAYPRRTMRQPVPEYRLTMGVVFRAGRVLVVQRPTEGLLGGLWEFPGGSLDNGLPAAACERVVRQVVGLEVHADHRLAIIRHAYTHFRINAEVFCCRWEAGRVRRRGPAAHRWMPPEALKSLPFTGACRKFLDRIGACLA